GLTPRAPRAPVAAFPDGRCVLATHPTVGHGNSRQRRQRREERNGRPKRSDQPVVRRHELTSLPLGYLKPSSLSPRRGCRLPSRTRDWWSIQMAQFSTVKPGTAARSVSAVTTEQLPNENV